MLLSELAGQVRVPKLLRLSLACAMSLAGARGWISEIAQKDNS